MVRLARRRRVLILGSGPNAPEAAGWDRAQFDAILAINNAWQVRPDWDFHIHPEDFPEDRRPAPQSGQRLITHRDFVPAQNALGGFVYAGGTMAMTAAYWALHALDPAVIAMMGCDMVYSATGDTHFYGTGRPDPLRDDITLRNLAAKSARLMAVAAAGGCAMVNLSRATESRLVFPRARPEGLDTVRPGHFDIAAPLAAESAAGYLAPSGRYWEVAHRFDPEVIDRIDALWLRAVAPAPSGQDQRPKPERDAKGDMPRQAQQARLPGVRRA